MDCSKLIEGGKGSSYLLMPTKVAFEENLNCVNLMLSVELTSETQERQTEIISKGVKNSWVTIQYLLECIN